MLVLSRKVGEKIQIGDGITVIVTRIAGHRVTLGVDAPRNMRIIRSELKPIVNAEDATGRASVMASSPTLTIDVSRQGVEMTAIRRAR